MKAVQGSGGCVQSQGGQLVPAGQAGQAQTLGGGATVPPAGTVAVPAVALPLAFPAPVLPALTVMVVVVAAPQLQLHGAHAVPGGHVGQAHVQVPPPVLLPAPVVVPHAPLPPLPPPAPVPPPLPPLPMAPPPPPAPVLQSHLQGGQASPGAQAGHAQVQVPPPAVAPPPS